MALESSASQATTPSMEAPLNDTPKLSSISSVGSDSKKKKPKRHSRKTTEKRKSLPAHLIHIQKRMTNLQDELASLENFGRIMADELESKSNLTDEEKAILSRRQQSEAALAELKTLYADLSSNDMLRKSTVTNDQKSDAHANAQTPSSVGEDEMLTLLHFFYVVRLAQKGFFSVIANTYPDVEFNALVHLCDRMVGSSLFAAKGEKQDVRDAKRTEVLNLVKQLHQGTDDRVDGFRSTFKHIKDLVFHLASSSTSSQLQLTTSATAPPVLLVVPFSGMIDVPTPLFNPAISGIPSVLPSPAPPATQPRATEHKSLSEEKAAKETRASMSESHKASSEDTDQSTPLTTPLDIPDNSADEVESPKSSEQGPAKMANESWNQVSTAVRHREKSNESSDAGARGSRFGRENRGYSGRNRTRGRSGFSKTSDSKGAREKPSASAAPSSGNGWGPLPT